MQSFSTNPLKTFKTRTHKATALATTLLLILIASFAYIQSRPNNPDTLAGYYAQQLTWKSCYKDNQCSELLVPIDYTNLSTGTFTISLLKYPALGAKKIGSLIVNPGGPGGSGVDYAYAAEYIFSPEILERYDIVGFDPRGVSRSAPIRCLTDKELDANFAADAKPDNAKELKQTLIETKKYIEICKDKNKYLPAYSTANAARDMDILRQAVGDKQLNFLGKSYGTYLGTLYAHFFPDKIGRVVLDGAVDPTISNYQQSLTQAVGFAKAFTSFAADCTKQKNCPLPKDKDAAIIFMQQLFTQVATQPMASTKTPDRLLSESLMDLGTASAMYDSTTGWPDLRAAITQAKTGKGDKFLELADQYNGREKNGTYQSNEFDSGAIIDCLDFTEPRTIKEMKVDATAFARQAPLFGPYLAYNGLTCKYLNASEEIKIAPLKTANPIIVIGTTGDPATPYAWAQGLHKLLTNSFLLTLTGRGHTGQGQGNDCIDSQIDAFYLKNQSLKTPTCT